MLNKEVFEGLTDFVASWFFDHSISRFFEWGIVPSSPIRQQDYRLDEEVIDYADGYGIV